MALSEKDIQKIGAIFEEKIKRLKGGGRSKGKELIKLTKKRLYAYPLLKENIERYKADIEDIRREDFGKSKSIVMYSPAGGGEKPTLEELREAKILIVERKIARDEAEIKEMDIALATIRHDEYYPVIELAYVAKMSNEDIAGKENWSVASVKRHKGRLIDILSASLYGADVTELLT